MATRYFFSASGDYLGAFDDSKMMDPSEKEAWWLQVLPPDAIEVQSPPNHGKDRLVDGVIVPYDPEQDKTFNEKLEEAFLSMLPQHIGQPYFTPELILQIGTAKQAVADFNKLEQYALSKAIISELTLPDEMTADRDALLALYPN